jgi:tetratricopeptide (TPR) repeat protein
MGDGSDPKSGRRPSAQERAKDTQQLKEEMLERLKQNRIAGTPDLRPPKRTAVPARAKDPSIPAPRAPRKASSPKAGKSPARAASKSKAAAPRVQARPGAVAWDPRRVRQFLSGEITLGELEGISKDAQYEMAETGHRLLTQGKLDDAKKVFEGLAVLDPHDAYFHLALGAVAQKSSDLEAADRHYSRALELNPYSCHALANRGEVRMMSGRLVEGAKDLLRALDEDPECREDATQRARATMAVVLEQLNEAGIAIPTSPDIKT